MARILIDAGSHQAIRHAGTEAEMYGNPQERSGRWRAVRLTGFIAALESTGHRLDLALPTASSLAGASAIVVASRSQALPFSADEVNAIVSFVRSGGGLLLMANHRLFVSPQQVLVKALNLPLRIEDVTISGSPEVRLRPHPITRGCAGLAIRNASVILPAQGADVVATYATDERLAFAIACEQTEDRRGRVVVTADSGFIASLDDKHRTLFESGGNARFIGNAMRWLLSAD